MKTYKGETGELYCAWCFKPTKEIKDVEEHILNHESEEFKKDYEENKDR